MGPVLIEKLRARLLPAAATDLALIKMRPAHLRLAAVMDLALIGTPHSQPILPTLDRK